MKIEIDVDTINNDCTSHPYWLILDPEQNLRCDVNILAGQITGPFFSRKEATAYFEATRYRYGKKARVYGCSGYNTNQYKYALDSAEEKEKNGQ